MAAFRGGLLKHISRGLVRCEERSRLSSERCINSVQLLGRVGRDPENGPGDFWKFPVATNYFHRTKDEFGELHRERHTQWHTAVAYKPYLQQKIQDMVSKGTRVLVHGHLKYFTIDAKESGYTRTVTHIVIDDLIVLSSRRNVQEENFDEDAPLEEMT